MYCVAICTRPESFAAYRKSPRSVNVMANAMSHTAGVRAASPNSKVARENNTMVLIARVAPCIPVTNTTDVSDSKDGCKNTTQMRNHAPSATMRPSPRTLIGSLPIRRRIISSKPSASVTCTSKNNDSGTACKFTFANWSSKICAVEEAAAMMNRAGHNTLSGLLNLAEMPTNTIT